MVAMQEWYPLNRVWLGGRFSEGDAPQYMLRKKKEDARNTHT
jgi:hypothetical protein